MHLDLLWELRSSSDPGLACPCIYTPIKLTAAKGRPIPAVGAPVAQVSHRH